MICFLERMCGGGKTDNGYYDLRSWELANNLLPLVCFEMKFHPVMFRQMIKQLNEHFAKRRKPEVGLVIYISK